jgi:hypothetical protein
MPRLPGSPVLPLLALVHQVPRSVDFSGVALGQRDDVRLLQNAAGQETGSVEFSVFAGLFRVGDSGFEPLTSSASML